MFVFFLVNFGYEFGERLFFRSNDLDIDEALFNPKPKLSSLDSAVSFI